MATGRAKDRDARSVSFRAHRPPGRPWQAASCAALLAMAHGCGARRASSATSSREDGDASSDASSQTGTEIADASDVQDTGNAVSGTVVDFTTNRPVEGPIVSAAGHEAYTDGEGQFRVAAQ